MNSKILLSSALLALAGAAGTNAHAAGDIERGKALYQTRCAACHSIDYNGVGPAHKGVFGSMAGKVAGYTYSDAPTASKVVWSEKTLNQWWPIRRSSSRVRRWACQSQRRKSVMTFWRS